MKTSITSQSFLFCLLLSFLSFALIAGQCPPPKKAAFAPKTLYTQITKMASEMRQRKKLFEKGDPQKLPLYDNTVIPNDEQLPIEPNAKRAITGWILISLLALFLTLVIGAALSPVIWFMLSIIDFCIRLTAFVNAEKSLKTFRENPGKYRGKGFAYFVTLIFPFTIGLSIVGVLLFVGVASITAWLVGLAALVICLIAVVATLK